jgi:poly-beta-1,6-N-acetyl-D-glucosamine biosynthesis protein PgaD
MDEPRQRSAYPEIIDIKGIKSKKRIFIETAITLSFWGLMLYLLTIFITFILWLFGLQLFYYEIYLTGFHEMKRLFDNALTITTVVVVVLLFWSYYNVALFKIKGERRVSRVIVSFDNDMAKFFKIEPEMLEKMKNYPRLNLSIEQDNLTCRETELPASTVFFPPKTGRAQSTD